MKNYSHKENPDVIWKEFLTITYAHRTDTSYGTDIRFHGSYRIVKTSKVLLQIDKVIENSDVEFTCYMFSLGILQRVILVDC